MTHDPSDLPPEPLEGPSATPPRDALASSADPNDQGLGGAGGSAQAPAFVDWEFVGLPAAVVRYALPDRGPPVVAPHSWLLTEGYRRPTRRPVAP